MGQKKRTKIKFGQRLKRKKRRLKLSKAGKDPNEHFYSGFYATRSK
ncbi:MAG: hypothetical protein ISS92_04545 [Candidatus Omnitrophica bacterium]|nr:hypothetical protein [Candidatus Omnitrophota bacterium]